MEVWGRGDEVRNGEHLGVVVEEIGRFVEKKKEICVWLKYWERRAEVTCGVARVGGQLVNW